MRLDGLAFIDTVAKPLLKLWLDCFDWVYVLDIENPEPQGAEWMLSFAQSVDTLDLFPCRRRFTTEPPGWVPIHFATTVNEIGYRL